jgi:hypothetical protein
MIHPEKLRTGNYIRTEPRSENNYYKVLKVDETMGSVSVEHYIPITTKSTNKENINLNCCFPIDITTEILHSSGFRETSPYKYAKDDLYLQVKRYGEAFLHSDSKDMTIHVSGINELQNAYNSITGKELEVVLS